MRYCDGDFCGRGKKNDSVVQHSRVIAEIVRTAGCPTSFQGGAAYTLNYSKSQNYDFSDLRKFPC
jgi:hypothetical protein